MTSQSFPLVHLYTCTYNSLIVLYSYQDNVVKSPSDNNHAWYYITVSTIHCTANDLLKKYTKAAFGEFLMNFAYLPVLRNSGFVSIHPKETLNSAKQSINS